MRAGAARVLVVEDDRATRDSMRTALELDGYEVETASDGATGLERVADGFDAVVLDVSLPYVDGLSMCRRLRAGGDRTPVLIVTARVEVADRVAGLDAGADDYLVKPYAVEELLARVRALVRRAAHEHDAPLVAGGLRLEPEARRAWLRGCELELTRTEFELLELMVRNAGVVLTRSVIYHEIWGYQLAEDSKNLEVYVGYLRRKLQRHGAADAIRTVRGVGYVLRAPAAAAGGGGGGAAT